MKEVGDRAAACSRSCNFSTAACSRQSGSRRSARRFRRPRKHLPLCADQSLRIEGSRETDMTTEGSIRTEAYDHVFKIIIDNPAKKNAFSPQMMEQLSDALTALHDNETYRVGVICAEGENFTAGLDMPKFFGPNAEKRNF